MSEEAKVEAAPVVEEAKPSEAAPTPSPVETTAREQGWVSKEEWVEAGNDPDAHRSAKEFVDRGELYKSLHSTRRELKQTQAAMTALQRHHQYVFDKAHRKALEDLKMEKRQAIRAEDFEAVEAIEDKIEQVQQDHEQEKEQIAKQVVVPVENSPHPDFSAWTERNQWYLTDTELQESADAYGIVYAKKNPGASPETVLKYVETQVRKQYPEKFGAKRAAPNPTAAVDRTSRRSSPASDVELDDNERAIMQDLVRNKVMTEAEYKAELKKVRGK